MFSLFICIIVNIGFILFYLQVEPVYLRVSNKPIQIILVFSIIGNSSTTLVKSAAQKSTYTYSDAFGWCAGPQAVSIRATEVNVVTPFIQRYAKCEAGYRHN